MYEFPKGLADLTCPANPSLQALLFLSTTGATREQRQGLHGRAALMETLHSTTDELSDVLKTITLTTKVKLSSGYQAPPRPKQTAR